MKKTYCDICGAEITCADTYAEASYGIYLAINGKIVWDKREVCNACRASIVLICKTEESELKKKAKVEKVL